MRTHGKKARIGLAIGLAMLWMYPLLTGDPRGLEAQVQQTTTQDPLAETAADPTADFGDTPATPEDFERECLSHSTACTAIVHSDHELPHATSPQVGRVINAYRWDWTDTVRYAWCSTRGCRYVGTIRLGAYLDLAGIESLWYQTADAITLPAVRATLRWNCVDDNGWLPNTSCSGGWQTRTNPHYTTGIFDAGDYNTHRDPGTYCTTSATHGKLQATRGSRGTTVPLRVPISSAPECGGNATSPAEGSHVDRVNRTKVRKVS